MGVIERDNKLTEKIIGCCFKLHTEIGPGHIEKTYHNGLIAIFEKENIVFESEKQYKLLYLEKEIGSFRADFVIENKLIIEIKSLERGIPEVFYRQTVSYLRSANLPLGLLVNFGTNRCQIKRIVV
ncbi:MAG: hypothetical protein A2452_05340 [Candidatus Firestonebacteria bacterium RIFOXYC2_FULL_39_67]|nr:MAG: hypothetical protein A2536_10170 [Candidatus Firestonebacteria bacterium RIFOXYD2_FULL_39_29]OGF54025.1 MAG: hypothetical protein A2497_08765 [Candidatus Firestonebacteria bacterium RifOxyC12_full_39_7]OGF56364.1 MAG: hypothetical protein A2452_05340 [Candidatus Firestonebacteria bacterium RIFOXYC2_FULL_39_67]